MDSASDEHSGDAGYKKMQRIENPRVGGSIPPLATIQIM